MAAPALVQSGTGAIWQSGGAVACTLSSAVAGNLALLHILDDGTDAISLSGFSNVENLAGTDNAMTEPFSGLAVVGSPQAAAQWLAFGRVISNGTVSVSVATLGSDAYFRLYEFSGVNTGTTFADIAENGATSFATPMDPSTINGAGTSTSVADTGVTTNGADRLALNLVGINDDLTGIAAFVGESGGDWAMPASFESATGTDGTIALMTATIASAGTINGGSDTITSDAWGVVGFALKPVAAAAFIEAPSIVAMQAVKRSSYY